ncbi:sugar phosphate isomerase/epimerase family protein [Deinococcus yavapaiensis]|uniref:Sugar phosphate isomerase/epimerase n=1 Tax=Deinococcus yavapaiensis KR-236 TaxID=694435 RepID=A0A318SDS6_9DEIO|nr:sugar phosphate isomerase/epimerase [Deinococcus yavapaiensis]PYE54589.1 sugar phosphate isomerase/epimerase [Deinococcus yavapaiensis KR-236]
MKVGLELYSVRDALAKDFEGTMTRVAEMGYEGVEFAGYYERSPEDLRALLDRLNLQPAGAHVSFERLETDFAREAEFARAVGFTYIAVPWWNAPDEDGWRAFSKRLGAVVEQAAGLGVTLSYHNHAHELTGQVDGRPVLDFLLAEHPALHAEFDVAWIDAGGGVPHDYLACYADRTPLLHIKDYRPGPVPVPLGTGEVDLPACLEAARAEWLVIEQDSSEGDMLADVERSLNWLRAHLNR